MFHMSDVLEENEEDYGYYSYSNFFSRRSRYSSSKFLCVNPNNINQCFSTSIIIK